MEKKIIINNKEFNYQIIKNDDQHIIFKFNNKDYTFDYIGHIENNLIIKNGKENLKMPISKDPFKNTFFSIINNKDLFLEIPSKGRKKINTEEEGHMVSPMPGKIFKVMIKIGDKVTKNQPLLIMEAMKMEHTIKANCDGVITKILYGEGELVSGGVELLEIDTLPSK